MIAGEASRRTGKSNDACAEAGFAVVFRRSVRTVSLKMSLNRAEQMTFDYLRGNPDENRHWLEKVKAISARARDPHAAAIELEDALWSYYEERSAVASPFREVAHREGLRRTSLRNLAEYLLRVWAPVKVKPRAEGAEPWRPYA